MDASLLGGSKEPLHSGMFGPVCLLVQALIIGVFWTAEIKQPDAATYTDSSSVFNYYVGVALMMFVGFGYLMTFLKGYGLGAVGLTMFITCIGVEYAMIIESYMGAGDLKLDFYSLLNGNFAVAAVLISFGGLIGKISPMQILVVVLVELTCYCANKVYLLGGVADKPGLIGDLVIADCGGTIIIHVFGAFFGLAAAKVLGDKDVPLNGSNYVSDIFSLVGTVFLWLYWPCFVSGALPPGAQQTAALTNTVLALLSSTVVTFAITPMLEKGKLTTVPIQNATLAGGVSIGATANAVGPFGAVVVGAIAGAVSTFGFVKGPTADFDTCGIFNLHGVPGLVGGIFSIVAPLMYTGGLMEEVGMVPVTQLATLGITLVVSIITGAGTGFLLKAMGEPTQPFDDTEFWECNDYTTSK
jgi:ammonium transporter Rh